MTVFEQLEDMGHERVLLCSNPEAGLRAIIAIHSTLLGPGLGGCRMRPFESFEEALTDVLRLSRGMTYKAAAAGLNLGGAKAVILGDPGKDKSEALFRAFGRYVDSLGGAYITAGDVGTNLEDMEVIQTETRWVGGVSPARGGGGDPSQVTAYGVMHGIRAAAEWHFGDASLAGRTVAIQGLGSVGYALAGYLKEEGVKLFGCDLDPEMNARAERELGLEVVPLDDILEVDCDFFAPCALGAVLNEQTIPRLRCKMVTGGANNQLDDEERDGRAIHERGILYAPDFVINAGGVINIYQALEGRYDRERSLGMTRGIFQNLTRVFEISASEGIPTHVAAGRLAEERLDDAKKSSSRHRGRSIDKRPAGF